MVWQPYEELLSLKPEFMESPFFEVPVGASFYSVQNRARYWYARWTEGGKREVRSLGRETPELAEKIEIMRGMSEKLKRRRKIVASLGKDGFPAPKREVADILSLLSKHQIFHAWGNSLYGGTLIGSASCYHAMLGRPSFPCHDWKDDGKIVLHDAGAILSTVNSLVRNGMFPSVGLRRIDDILIPQDTFLVDPETGVEVETLPVPDRKFMNLGMGFPNRFVVEMARRRRFAFLGFLLKDVVDAVIPVDDGIFVRVPDPGRYAVYRLLTAASRNTVKERAKDMGEAAGLLATLVETDKETVLSKISEAWRHEGWRMSLLGMVVGLSRAFCREGFDVLRDAMPGWRELMPKCDFE